MTKIDIITILWDIIDDIDAYGDLAKGDDKLFRGLVERKQEERWDLPITTDGYSLEITANSETKQKLAPSEALYGFAGWITTREDTVIASASHDAAIWAELVDAFIKENKLDQPRDGWENNLIHPGGECLGRAK